MHIGQNYSFKEILHWTKRDILRLLLIGSVPTLLYIFTGWNWLKLPWLPIALIGTAVSFIVGFKNNASYARLWEARTIWGGIVNYSRAWALGVKDYVADSQGEETAIHKIHKELYFRHLAWLTALRFQLRETKNWESINLPHNRKYRDENFKIEEQTEPLAEHLKKYLSEAELNQVLQKSNKPTQILGLQSARLRQLFEAGQIDLLKHIELQDILNELLKLQGGSERIKNFPYPRQYASMNKWYIQIFVFLIPFGMLQEFEKFNPDFIWLTIPFAALSGWIFTTMERVGEVSENPFEGSSNDVPITTMARGIEIDMLELLHIQHDLKPIPPQGVIST